MMTPKQGQAHGNNLNITHESAALGPQGVLFVSLCFHTPCRNSAVSGRNMGFGTFFRLQDGKYKLSLLSIALALERLL